ncbi:MAG: glycosyltransferase family 4 protein [Desulfobacterales bacterium]|nr:glycosyltransferase family 4 protein [Desulfobacterales bacterium]
MKVLIIEPSGRGGVCQHAHNLANALARRGCAVEVAGGVQFETKPFPRDYELIEVFDRFRPRPARLLKFLRFVRASRPDVIHMESAVHPGVCLVLWKILARFTRARFVYTAHDVFPKKQRKYHPWVLKQIYRGVDHIFVNAHQNKQEIIHHFNVAPTRISSLPVGDLMAFVRDLSWYRPRALPANGKIILFFGIIERRKGLLTLLRAFPIIKREIPEAFLLVVGKPHEDMAPYTRAIDELGISDHVSIRPEYAPLMEVAGVFGGADVVALPYDAGWNSGVISCAYGFGKPVAATSITGIPEVVKEGETGFLAPPGDPEAMARIIIRLLGDDALRRRMVPFIREAAERNAWPGIAAAAESVYRAILSNS